MCMVLLIFALGNFNIGAMKPFFLDSGSPRGGFVHVWAWFVIIVNFRNPMAEVLPVTPFF